MSTEKKSHKKPILVPFSVIAALVVLWFLLPKNFRDRLTGKANDVAPEKTYTAEDIENLAGCEFEPRDWTLMDVECRFLRFDGEPRNNYQKVQYYLFDTSDEANHAFLKMKDGGLKKRSMEATANTLYGWLDDVCDADIECFYLKKGNLLIVAEGVYGNYYSIDEEEQVMAANKKEQEEFEELKAWIPDNFSDI